MLIHECGICNVSFVTHKEVFPIFVAWVLMWEKGIFISTQRKNGLNANYFLRAITVKRNSKNPKFTIKVAPAFDFSFQNDSFLTDFVFNSAFLISWLAG